MLKKDSHSIKRFSHLEQRYRYAMCTRKVRTILEKAFVCRGSPLVKHNKTDALSIRSVALNVKPFDTVRILFEHRTGFESQPKVVGFLFEQVG